MRANWTTLKGNFADDCFGFDESERRHYMAERRVFVRGVGLLAYGWVSLSLAVLTVPVLIAFVYSLAKAARRRAVSKRYFVLLLNRCLADFLCCTCVAIQALWVVITQQISSSGVFGTLDKVSMCSFWLAMSTCVSLSALKLFAVWKPFAFLTKITTKKCFILNIAGWVLFLTMLGLGYLKRRLTYCKFFYELFRCGSHGVCGGILYNLNSVFAVFCYYTTLVIFLLTVLMVRRSLNTPNETIPTQCSSNDGVAQLSEAQKSLRKLAVSAIVFGVFYFPLVAYQITYYLGHHVDHCFPMRHTKKLKLALAVSRCFLFSRIFFDNFLGIVLDRTIRRALVSTLKQCRRATQFSASRESLSDDVCSSCNNDSHNSDVRAAVQMDELYAP